jgi:hypothetical protein
VVLTICAVSLALCSCARRRPRRLDPGSLVGWLVSSTAVTLSFAGADRST